MDLKSPVAANSCIAGLVTAKYCQIAFVLQQHIGCTTARDTETAISVVTTQDCTGIGDDSTATVLGNLRG